MLVDLDFTVFASLLRWKKLKGKNNLLEILTLQRKMKLNNSRVNFYLLSHTFTRSTKIMQCYVLNQQAYRCFDVHG